MSEPIEPAQLLEVPRKLGRPELFEEWIPYMEVDWSPSGRAYASQSIRVRRRVEESLKQLFGISEEA